MSVQDAAIAVPKYSVDKVFATDTKTFSIADTVATKFNSFTTTGISTIYDFVAVYSVDGTNWLDVNGTSGTGGTGFTARSTAVAATMWPDGTISMTISQRALINGGSNWTLYVRIAYLVRYDTTTIASNLLTTDKFLYSSRYSYMKIAVQGSFSVSSSSASIASRKRVNGNLESMKMREPPGIEIWISGREISSLPRSEFCLVK